MKILIFEKGVLFYQPTELLLSFCQLGGEKEHLLQNTHLHVIHKILVYVETFTEQPYYLFIVKTKFLSFCQLGGEKEHLLRNTHLHVIHKILVYVETFTEQPYYLFIVKTTFSTLRQ